MKKLFLIAAALVAVTIAVPASIATPASAQVNIRAGEHGVGVRVGPAPRVHRHRGAHRSDWRRSRARDCRTVRTRTVTPSGRVVMNTRRVCR
jgi:hypothetical protein